MAMMYKRIQGNGSITIPSKLRHRLGLEPHDALELAEQDNGDIVLRQYHPRCIWCGGVEKVAVIKGVRMCLKCYGRLAPGEKGGGGDDTVGTEQ